MSNKVVFCTSLVDSDPQRYQNWIDYYTEFFAGHDISLWMINDGPVHTALDLKGVELKSFDKQLGRQTTWIFPGWKRSFFYALVWATQKYKCISHIESDCWVTNNGKSDFLFYLEQGGYFTGFVPAYRFPEAALQIVNSQGVRQFVIDKYSCMENWYENIDFEKDLERLNPTYILDGDRIEGNFSRYSSRFTFVSGISYQDFKRLKNG